MEQIKTDVESFARIRVVGVGGSGGNAVNYMVSNKVKGVEFIAVNSDAQDLHHSLAKRKIHIGLVQVVILSRDGERLKKLVKRLPTRSKDQT